MAEFRSEKQQPLAARRISADRGLALVEEAYCLLRSAGFQTLALFYLGAVPFVAAVFYFWADMSRSSFAAADALPAALGAALAYLWMKTLQALFCRRLWIRINAEGDLPELKGGVRAGALAANVVVHSLALPLLALALLFLVPFAWVYAFFHNATVLALVRESDGRPLRGLVADAARLSHWRWGANHVVVGVAALVAFLVWANLVMLAVVAPQLVKWVFGVESAFTLFPLATLANTTFLFGSLLASFLVVGPLTKAIYVLRCFYAGSRGSGVDLLSRLAAIRREKRAMARASAGSVAVVMAIVVVSPATALAQLNNEVPSSERVEALDAAIEQTLRGKSYQWRLARDPDAAGLTPEEDGKRGFATAVEASFERLGQSLKRFFASLFQGGRGGADPRREGMAGGGGGALAMVLALLSLAVILALLAWAFIQVRRRSRSAGVAGSGAEMPDDAGEIDLEQDDLVASQLPEDEWRRLAEEQIAAGQFRLAVRALFLGCLANLGARKLIDIARFKSNRAYRVELDLKARSLPELRGAFVEVVAVFERAWYGVHEPAETETRAVAENCALMASAGHVSTAESVGGKGGSHA